MLSFIAIIKAIILPPTVNFIIIAFGLLLNKINKHFSYLLITVGALSLVLFCFPPFSALLLKGLEQYPPLEPPVTVHNEQAIVVLSAGSYPYAKEYAKAIDGAAALQRNQYAAFLQNQTDLPILVSGGTVGFNTSSEAAIMTDTLSNSFKVQVKWQETKSRNTAENAMYSAAILKENDIETIYLVTHAWHMPRAVMMFEKQGINVTPAPTMFIEMMTNISSSYYLPAAYALQNVNIALHEYIGIFWYKLRY
jgi:uncharacterized SAM-binding protein YcdF (DUF218 family)